MGLDPVLERIPLKGKPEQVIYEFYHSILEEMTGRNLYPAAVKPNLAFYEAVSVECLQVLKTLISDFQKAGVLVILDAKKGDIGKTSAAYAKMAFEVFKADAVTVAPYMGYDSIAPFQEISQNQGVYVLTRTSNPGAADFQEACLAREDKQLYQLVAEKISDWNDGNLGAVVGATAPQELEALLKMWISRGSEIPCLIPGVSVSGIKGGQGGSLEEVFRSISNAGGDRNLHLINSSSGLNYAWEKYPDKTYWQATVTALEEMAAEMASF
jgi:orotidine-5'-phosphate decarboxylase